MGKHDTQTYSFPEMKVHDILESLNEEFGFSCTEAELCNPTPKFVERLYLALVEGVYREKTRGDLWRADARSLARRTPDMEESEDTLAFVMFWKKLRTLMQYAYVRDFTVSDLEEPDSKRLRKHLAGIINFNLHKTTRHERFNQFLEMGEELRFEVDTKRDELMQLQTKAEELKVEREKIADRVEHEKNEQKQLSATLQEYRAEQAEKAAELDGLRQQDEAASQACALLAQKRECALKKLEELKSLIVEPAEDLQGNVDDLKRRTTAAQGKLANMQKDIESSSERVALFDVVSRKFASLNELVNNVVSAEANRCEVENRHEQAEQRAAQLTKKVASTRARLDARLKSVADMEKTHVEYKQTREYEDKKQVEEQERMREDMAAVQKQVKSVQQEIKNKSKQVADLEQAQREVELETETWRAEWRAKENRAAEIRRSYERRLEAEIISKLPDISETPSLKDVSDSFGSPGPTFGSGSPHPAPYPDVKAPDVSWCSPSLRGAQSPVVPSVPLAACARGSPSPSHTKSRTKVFTPSPQGTPGLHAFASPATSVRRQMFNASPGFRPAPRTTSTPKPLRV